MESIIEVSNAVKEILNEDIVHLKELNAADYVRKLEYSGFKDRFNQNNPSIYMKANTRIAKGLGYYSKKLNDDGEQMDCFSDKNYKAISENEFKKDVLDILLPKGFSNNLVNDAVNDLIEKVHKVQDGKEID